MGKHSKKPIEQRLSIWEEEQLSKQRAKEALLLAKKQEEEAKAEAQRREEINAEHLKEMHELNKGWYVVTITGNAFKIRGNDGSVTKSVKVLADSKMDAYNKSIRNLEENPPKNVMNFTHFESSRSALIEYVGVWTDEAEIEYGN